MQPGVPATGQPVTIDQIQGPAGQPVQQQPGQIPFEVQQQQQVQPAPQPVPVQPDDGIGTLLNGLFG
jgi:hypothetical protein